MKLSSKMFALAIFLGVMASAAIAGYTTLSGVALVNSTVDSTSIGSSTPAYGRFTFLISTGLSSSGNSCIQANAAGDIFIADPEYCHQVQSMRIASGICTTGNGAYAGCSFVSPNWGETWTDTAYAVSCFAMNPTLAPNGGSGVSIYVSSKTTSNLTILLSNVGVSADAIPSTAAEIDCIGVR